MESFTQLVTDLFPVIRALAWMFWTMAYAVLLWLGIKWLIQRYAPTQRPIPDYGDEFPENVPVGHMFFYTKSQLLYRFDGEDWVVAPARS